MWWLRVDVSKRRFLKIEKGQILQIAWIFFTKTEKISLPTSLQAEIKGVGQPLPFCKRPCLLRVNVVVSLDS